MIYTINGKQYTILDINKRCAELRGIAVEYPMFNEIPYHKYLSDGGTKINLACYDPCNNPQDAWTIIEKIFDKLMLTHVDDGDYAPKWETIREKHNCSALVAACIYFIESES